MRRSGSNAIDSGLNAFQVIIDFPAIFQTFVISIDVTRRRSKRVLFFFINTVNQDIFVIPSVRAFV